MKIALVSQPEYFKLHYENELDSLGEVRHFDMVWSGRPDDFKALADFQADYNFIFRAEIVPDETINALRGVKIGLSSEPFPKLINDQFEYTMDSLERFRFFTKINWKALDYLLHYDQISRSFLERQGFRLSGYRQFPIARSVYRPSTAPKEYDIFFNGKSTEHREKLLGRVKRDFKFFHVAYGLFGQELISFINRSRICLNVHAENETSWEPRMQQLLACGALVVSEPITENPYVQPGKEFVEFHSEGELYDICAQIVRNPDGYTSHPQAGLKAMQLHFDPLDYFKRMISEIESGEMKRHVVNPRLIDTTPFEIAKKYHGFGHLIERFKHEVR
jgi:hypothetical protein